MILGMTGEIDDEAEPAAPGILVTRYQEATLIVVSSSVAADDRHDLGHAWVMLGEDRRGDDVVCRMALIKSAAILEPAFAFGQLGAVDRLPFIRPGIANGLFRRGPLVAGEQLRKAERHDRPFAILLI